MSRYIDAEKLTVYFEALAKQAEMEGLYNMAHIHNRCLQIIEDAPTADVVEVVHAEWVGTEYDGYADGYPVYDKWECSKCHEEYNSDGEPPMFNYCPNCGAKMDGERSENDNS